MPHSICAPSIPTTLFSFLRSCDTIPRSHDNSSKSFLLYYCCLSLSRNTFVCEEACPRLRSASRPRFGSHPATDPRPRPGPRLAARAVPLPARPAPAQLRSAPTFGDSPPSEPPQGPSSLCLCPAPPHLSADTACHLPLRARRCFSHSVKHTCCARVPYIGVPAARQPIGAQNVAFVSRRFCFPPLLHPASPFAPFIAEGGQSGVT